MRWREGVGEDEVRGDDEDEDGGGDGEGMGKEKWKMEREMRAGKWWKSDRNRNSRVVIMVH